MSETIPLETELPIVIPMERIPNSIFGNEITPDIKAQLSRGQKPYFDQLNIKDEHGSMVKPGRIWFEKDKSGNITLATEFKAPELTIPKKLFNNDLEEAVVSDLKNNKIAGPIKNELNENVYLQVDNKLNKVTVKSEMELGVPQKELLGYNLSERDKEKFAKGQELPARVFEHNGNFFISNIQKTADNKGLSFSNTIFLKPEEVKAAIEKYNKPEIDLTPERNFANIIEAGNKAVQENQKETSLGTVVGAANTTIKEVRLEDPLMDAIKAKDYDKISQLSEKGIKPEEKHINYIKESKDIAPAEKAGIATLLKIEPDKITQKTTKIEQTKSPEIKITSKDKGVSI